MNIERLNSNDRMSQIVRHNGVIYLSGQVAASPDTDVAEQMRLCLEKAEVLLTEVGVNSDSILSVLIHINDMANFAAMNAAWDGWFKDKPKPARTCVEAKMARPEVLVELTIIAADVE